MVRPVSTHDQILVERGDDGVTVITINRPARLNALTEQTRAELIGALQELTSDAGTRAVVLTGAGDRAFAAGQDLAEAQQFGPERIETWIIEWTRLYDAILSCPHPVIAAVNGYAVGAAFQMALMCDLRLAAENARFGMPEIDDAIPCITGTWTLYDVVGRSRTAELILTGRQLDAEEALVWGIVHRIVPNDQLMNVALDQARILAAKPATAMRLNKQWLRKLMMTNLAETTAFAKRAHAEAFGSGEPRQAMANFLAKRREGRAT